MKRLVLGVALSLGVISGAYAQTTSPEAGYPVYDSSNNWGLSNAGVASGPYLKAGAGHSWGSGNFDDGWVYGGGIGYRFTPWFRTDATFDYRSDFHDGGSGGARFRNWSAMLNGYIDVNVPIIRPLIPFVGAGAGISQNKVNGTTVTVGGTSVASITGSTKDQFAWQVMAGVSYYFTPATALEVGYRYFHGGSAESGTATGFPTHSGDFNTHEVMAYLRIGF
jgi:opacity protein-like surface antigen